MAEYLPSTYGDRIADLYDTLHPGYDPAAIDFLQGLAGQGPVLELGIGTGRMALPLVERGVRLHGIDSSEAIVAKLREKPGGRELPITIGDFASFELEERFSLIFVAFNTIFALPTQEEQVGCFRSVAAHLRDGGHFVVEAFVPDLARFDRGQRLAVSQVQVDSVVLEASRHDPARQQVDAQMIHITEAGTRLIPVRIRYAWPAELDLMARLAGLTLENRWAGWQRQAFGPDSPSHLSHYRKPG